MSCQKETQLSENLSRQLGSPLPSFDVQKIYHQLNDLANLNKPKNKSQIIDATHLRLFLPTNTEFSPIFAQSDHRLLANEFELNTNDQTGVLNYRLVDQTEQETNFKLLFRFDDRGKIQDFAVMKQNDESWQAAPNTDEAKKIVLAAQAAMFHGLLAEKLVFKRPVLEPSPAQATANYYHAYRNSPDYITTVNVKK